MSSSGDNLSVSVDLGTHTGNFLVVVGYENDHGAQPTVTTAAGASLTQEVFGTNMSGNGQSAGIYDAVLTPSEGGVQTIVMNESAGNFFVRSVSVWTIDNYDSPAPALTNVSDTARDNPTIFSVLPGDFIFAIGSMGAFMSDFTTSSTLAPNAQHTAGNSVQAPSADWLITASNASFHVSPGSSSAFGAAVALYR